MDYLLSEFDENQIEEDDIEEKIADEIEDETIDAEVEETSINKEPRNTDINKEIQFYEKRRDFQARKDEERVRILKATNLTLESVTRPSSSICNNKFNTSG